MRRILLTIISLLPLLSYGQSMKIAPKQIEPGDKDGKVIITRNGVSVLDSVKWLDVNGKPTDLEHTSNKVTNLNSPDNTTYPTTQAVTGWVNNQGFLTSETDPVYTADKPNLFRTDDHNTNNAVNILDANKLFNGVAGLPAAAANNPNSNQNTLLTVRNTSATGWQMSGDAKNNIFFRSSYWTGSAQNWRDWKELLGEGDNISLFNNDAGYITSSSIPAAQTLSINGHDLSLSGGGGTVAIPDNNTTYSGSTSINLSGTSFQRAALTGDVTASANSNSTTISNSAVTFPKIQNIPTQTLMGRYASGSGNVQSITLGSNLSLNGSGVLSATNTNTTYSAGTGLSLSGTTFNNTAPDKTVVLNTGTGINVTGSYPNFTITNTAPNQSYTLPTASASTLGGIKVGNNLSIASGVLSADVGTNDLFSGNYNDLTNKPTIPTVNNGTLTLATGTGLTGSQTFTANSSTNKTFTVGLNAALNNLNDVSASSPSSGQLLRYNGTAWANWTPNYLTSFTETDPVYTADNENIMIRRDNLSSSENLNDVLVSGIYFQLVNNNATTALNYPLAGQGGVLEVFKGSDNRAMQRFTARPTSSTPITFVRRMYANAWSDWVQLANTDDIPTVNNGSLTLNTSGIATGSTTFSANQANNSSVTVSVPGTNLGGNFSLLNSKINVTSSTGTNASIDVPFAFDGAGYMTTTGNEGFNTGGGFSTNITKITANSSSHSINSNDYTIIVAAENCTLNIPSPLDCTGRFIRIVYQSASPTKVTLGINQPQDLTGSPIAQMNNAGALLIQSDGTNWIQVNNYSN